MALPGCSLSSLRFHKLLCAFAGAGKTTLLDVLSGRRTGRGVAGVISLNGHRVSAAQVRQIFACQPLLQTNLLRSNFTAHSVAGVISLNGHRVSAAQVS